MDEQKSRRLARAILADVMLYNEEQMAQLAKTSKVSPELESAVAEGRELYLSRGGPPELFEREWKMLKLTGALSKD